MNFIPEWAPNIHPMLVHFPIVLLIFALVMDLLGLLWNERNSWQKSALLLYGFGALALVVVYFSGRQAADQVQVADALLPFISDHSDWARRALWFWTGFVVLRFGLVLRHWDSRRAVLALFILAALSGNFLVYQTAEHGAKLVYRYGVGVRSPQDGEKANAPEAGTFRATGEEVFWQVGRGTLSVVLSELTWRNFPRDGVRAELVQEVDGPAMAIRLQSARTVILLPGEFNEVSLEAVLRLDEFSGSVLLTTHFADESSFDFLGAARDTLSLGRRLQSRTKKWGQKPVRLSGWKSLKIVSTSGHFRGFTEGEMVLHGHDEDLPAGRVGLIIRGDGVVKLRSLRAVSLGPKSR